MVVAVKMNRKRLVVMLEEVAFIYDISNMKMLHQQTLPLNPAGIGAISPNSENNYLAIPHYQKTTRSGYAQPAHVPKSATNKEPISGDILLYDLNKMEEVTVIQAHQAPISFITLNNDGTLMATSSEKGTIIRVFSIPDGRKLYQFRRGSMPARIYSMSFNATSTLLCVSSATETVHIFKLAPPAGAANTNDPTSRSRPLSPTSPRKTSFFSDRSSSPPPSGSLSPPTYDSNNNPDNDNDHPSTSSSSNNNNNNMPAQPRAQGLMSLMRRTSANMTTTLVGRAAGYLPASVTEIWEPQRDFAWVRVPRASTAAAGGAPARCVVAMAHHVPHVMVATSEGEFLVYSVDLEKGGEGVLVKRFE
jgi:autophagy-related protein 18